MCSACESLLAAEAEAAITLARWRDENDPKPLGEAIDSALSLVPGRVERRRWAVRALVVIRSKGITPAVVDGRLRVPMEDLPETLRTWLAEPVNRQAVEDLLDEERREPLRLFFEEDAA